LGETGPSIQAVGLATFGSSSVGSNGLLPQPTTRIQPREALTDIWTTDDGAVVIFYDVRGIVTGSAAAGSGIDDRPSKLIALLDRIRSWFF
jgi:hypothetical protein